jgi:hypothetical protein
VKGVIPDAFTIEECLRDCITFGNEGHDWAGGAVYVGGWVCEYVRTTHPRGIVRQWVFDPVVVCHTLEDALDAAHITDQTHIFDLYRGESIPTDSDMLGLYLRDLEDIEAWERMERGDYS